MNFSHQLSKGSDSIIQSLLSHKEGEIAMNFSHQLSKGSESIIHSLLPHNYAPKPNNLNNREGGWVRRGDCNEPFSSIE